MDKSVGARRTSGCAGDDGLARARWPVQQDTPHGRATVAMGVIRTLVSCLHLLGSMEAWRKTESWSETSEASAPARRPP
jgi:hypothetical protein